MRTQILIFLVFTVYCLGQINAESKHSIEGRNSIAKRELFKANALADDPKVVVPILGPLERIIKEILEAIEKILQIESPDKDPLGLIANIVRKVIALLNKILPEKLQLSIISIEIKNNVIIIKIGQGDVPDDPPTPPTPPTDPEDPPTPPPAPPVPAYPYPYPPVYPQPPVVQVSTHPIYYRQPSRPVYLSKPTYIFVKPNKPDYSANNYGSGNSALDSIAY